MLTLASLPMLKHLKSQWDEEWNIGKGGAGPDDQQLDELDELGLWYEGSTRCTKIHPPTRLLNLR